MLTYYQINKSQRLEPKETIDWKRKTLEKPDVSAIGKYRDLLSDEEILLFNSLAAKHLKVYIYD